MQKMITISNQSKEIADALLDVKAIQLKLDPPFKWSSGWLSPIYCDNRITLSYPSLRTTIKKALTENIRKYYPEVEAIAGVATAGIPQGTLVSDELNLPFIYVRSKPKAHGMTNLIEGSLEKGKKYVLIEDLISTGGSSLKACEAIVESGGEVLGLCSIFTYDLPIGRKNLEDAAVPLISLSDYNTLIEHAHSKNYFKTEEVQMLKAWRLDPEHWNI